jgi:hypothetical protein
MVPDWTEAGLLPVGVHVADWAEVQSRFGNNSRRRVLLGGLREASIALAAAGCTGVWLDGSFVSSQDIPGDYDACWDWHGVDHSKLDPILLDYSVAGRALIKAKYLGDVLINTVERSSGLVFAEFFQLTRDGKDKGIVAFDPRWAR